MYFYSANALGLAAQFSRPLQQILPSQASAVLAVNGGDASARVENFSFQEMLSFRSVSVQVGGRQGEHGAYTTLSTATIEQLNILDIVTAGRIVARLSSHQSPQDAEPRIIAIGCSFENLKIFDQPVRVRLDTNIFDQYDTFEKFDQAYKKSRKDVDPWLVGSKLRGLKGGEHTFLDKLREGSSKAAQERSFYWASPANDLKVESPSLSSYGSILVVPNFGIIHLAELLIQKSQRQLNMLRIELGSPVGGSLVAASVSCGGLPGDPTVDDE